VRQEESFGLFREARTQTFRLERPTSLEVSIGRPAVDDSAVYEIDPLIDSRWPRFLRGNLQASVFHNRGWLKAIYRTYGCEPSVLARCGEDGELASGLVFCRMRSWISGPRFVSVPFSDHCEPLAVTMNERERLLSAFEERANAEGGRYVELRPASPFWEGLRSGWSTSQTFYLHRLDLRAGRDGVFGNFHRDCIQRRIRHAEKQGIAITVGRSPECLQDFYKLVLATRRRHGLPPQPIAWFRNLLECLGDSATIRFARMDGRTIAAILTLQHEKSVYYKYGASTASLHKLGAVPLLIWHTIQDAIDNGLEELDMGRSDCENSGLIAFKERWAAKRSTLSYLRFPPNAPQRVGNSRWSRNLSRGACRFAPDKCLAAIGAFSYRHIE
jgi:Acetyltransferase (GNAT) domain